MFGLGRKHREYSDQQLEFLAALRDPANKGDIKLCQKLAGYSTSISASHTIKSLKDEILEIAKEMLAANSVKASLAIIGAIDDPMEDGLKEKTLNAERLLDRVGIVKGEQVHLDTNSSRIAIIPARQRDDD